MLKMIVEECLCEKDLPYLHAKTILISIIRYTFGTGEQRAKDIFPSCYKKANIEMLDS